MKFNMPHIIANCIRTPDGTLLRSRHRHDYVYYVDDNDHSYSVDGGMDYLKRSHSVNAPPATECSVYSDDTHSNIRKVFEWGTRGKTGQDPLTYLVLKNMDTEHIVNILLTQKQISDHVRDIFTDELVYRSQDD